MVTRRDQILDAAFREFADAGFAGARIDGIARAAATNKRMIYHYFGNKEGLYSAVCARAAGAFDVEGAAHADEEALRILLWSALERHEVRWAVTDRMRARLAAIERQQHGGEIRADITARTVLALELGYKLASSLIGDESNDAGDPELDAVDPDPNRVLAMLLKPHGRPEKPRIRLKMRR